MIEPRQCKIWWLPCPRCKAKPGERCNVKRFRSLAWGKLSDYCAGRMDRANRAWMFSCNDAANARDNQANEIAGDRTRYRTDRLERYMRKIGAVECNEPPADVRSYLTDRRWLTTAEIKAELQRVEIIGTEATGVGGSVYRCYDHIGQLVYVGKAYAGHVRSRLRDHARKAWWESIQTVVIVPFVHYTIAESAERAAIITERPIANIVHAPSPSLVEPVSSA